MTDKILFPNDTVCLFSLEAIELLLIEACSDKRKLKLTAESFQQFSPKKSEPKPRRHWRFKKWLYNELLI